MFRKFTVLHKLFSIVWTNNKQIQVRILTGVLLVIVSSLLALLVPWCLKFIVEYFNTTALYSKLILLLTSYGIIWLLSHAIVDLRQIIGYRVFEKGIHRLTSEIFQKILNLSLKYHTSNTTGNIMNSIERAQQSLPIILNNLMFAVFPRTIEVIIAVCVLWYYYGTTIAGVLFLIFLIYAVFSWYSTPWVVEAQRSGNKAHKKVSDYITDVLMNIEGVHYHSAHKLVSLKCEKYMMKRENAFIVRLTRTGVVSLGQTVITGLGFICMTLLVGTKVASNQLVVSDFILINGYLIQFLTPLGAIGDSILRSIKKNLTQMEDVIELLNEKEDIIDSPLAKKIKQNLFDIRFKNVSFVHTDKEDRVLKNINFNLPEGKSLAIVGANGSGKSTIVKLLYRLFDVSKGQIAIQKQNINSIKLSELRQLIAVVPQDVFLLNDTIYQNILFGTDINNSEEDFKTIAGITNIGKWVSDLPDGYMTLVGERGIRLSGGERKRIGIARALLRKPKILILDEAMTSLDVYTEYKILNHIREHYKKLSQIIITHNEKYLFTVDSVMYLENGSIQAYGSHSELLSTNKQYRKIWQKQKNKKTIHC